MKKKSEETVKSLLTDFKDDMSTVENTHKNKQKGAETQVAKLENKVMKQTKMIDELKNLLQITVKSDQKKDALLAEVKVAFEKEKTKVERRINELDAEKNGVEKYKRDLKQESLQLREQVDGLEYHNKELTSKNRQLQEFLTSKEYECDNLVKENEQNKKSLKACSLELEQIKES